MNFGKLSCVKWEGSSPTLDDPRRPFPQLIYILNNSLIRYVKKLAENGVQD